MALFRPRRFASLPLAVALIVLTACGGAPQPQSDTTQTAPVEDMQTQPSEAAQAQIEAGATAPETPTGSDAASQMLSQIAGITGAMHAAAKLCDPNVSDAQLTQAKDQSRREFIQLGGDAGTFDGEFAAAHESTSRQFNGATPAQQTQMCDELRAMAAQTPPPPAS